MTYRVSRPNERTPILPTSTVQLNHGKTLEDDFFSHLPLSQRLVLLDEDPWTTNTSEYIQTVDDMVVLNRACTSAVSSDNSIGGSLH